MDQEYENKLKRCDIRKGHIVQVIVKETSSNFPQRGGDVLWKTTGKDFGSMHAVIKAIYEAFEARNAAAGRKAMEYHMEQSKLRRIAQYF